MTTDAAVVFHAVEIVGHFDIGRRVFAAEDLGLGKVHHRVPVDRRVILCCRGFVRCGHGFQVELLARFTFGFGGVDQTVAAHPDVVFGFRQIGDDITTLIVGDDNADETHRQIVRFGDHPDAGLRAFGAGDNATDVVAVNGDRGRLLRLQCGWRDQPERCNTDCSDAGQNKFFHGLAPYCSRRFGSELTQKRRRSNAEAAYLAGPTIRPLYPPCCRKPRAPEGLRRQYCRGRAGRFRNSCCRWVGILETCFAQTHHITAPHGGQTSWAAYRRGQAGGG